MARTATDHTVVVESARLEGPVQMEEIGTAHIIPGELIQYETNGYVQRHATAGGPGAPFFAIETKTPDTNEYPTTAAKDIPYADGDTVYFVQASPGDVIDARLKSGESVTKGIHYLGSAGDGTLASIGTANAAVGTGNPVALAWETVNASGGTAERIKVKAL